MSKNLILCDCAGSMHIDRQALETATGVACSRVHTALCTRQIDAAAAAIAAGDAMIACGQETARFEDLAEQLGVPTPVFVDLRDRAGWTDGPDATAKMAALIALAQVELPASRSLDVTSDGQCLIIGESDVALQAAEQLADTLAVTVLMRDASGIDTPAAKYQIVTGGVIAATGSLGGFELVIDGLSQLIPGGRGAPGWTDPQNGARSRCDIILDLSGATALFTAPHKRDGYLRADPRSQPAAAKAVFEAAQHIGSFDKPMHVALAPHLCAHSRAEITGCTRCLDACPTGAIQPAGEHVMVDPLICAGCGACAALCPSGAISFAAPPVDTVLRQITVLAQSFAKAGGSAPRLLVHDDTFGHALIALSARHGRGLPPDVLPLSVAALLNIGHAEILAAIASGFVAVDILLAPQSERAPIAAEVTLARAMGADGRVRVLDLDEPDALETALYGQPIIPLANGPILAQGGRRQVARLAAKALLADVSAPHPLPAGAPYGAVLVNTDSCTLCLSCVSLCPSGALLDNEDKPQLRFQEDACLQCGICANACPENAITLLPQFDPTDGALAQRVLNEEEPFCCIECGKAFGVRATVEKIIEKLAGKHAMFSTSSAARMIQMCDTCRIKAQYHSDDNPFAGAARPRVRTTDDYFSKRKDH